MRNFRSIIVTICSLAAFGFSFSSIAAHDEYRYSDDYEYYSDVYNSRLGTECDFSSISVGMGNVRNGVVVTIDSLDEGVTRCIKKSSWISYFSSFGNSVSVEISNTTL